jgi:hypothetical protein
MRESFSVLLLVALALSFLLALAPARSAELKPVTITGVCAESTPKEAQSCQDVSWPARWQEGRQRLPQ